MNDQKNSEFHEDFEEAVKLMNLSGMIIIDKESMQLSDKFFTLMVNHGILDLTREITNATYLNSILMKVVLESVEKTIDRELAVNCFILLKGIFALSLRKSDTPDSRRVLKMLEEE